jgi:hypothetical protein
MLGDIAVVTGGSSSARTWASSSRTSRSSDLGQAKRVVVDKDNTLIIEGAGKKKDIKARSSRSAQIEKTTSDYDREKLQERLAKLTGGVAVIRVGAATETEMKERKDLIDDALHATRAAAEGIVPGGGVAFLRAIEAVEAGKRRPRATRRSASTSSPRPCVPGPPDRRQRRRGRRVSSPRSWRTRTATTATTPPPASTWTCSRPASSTRPRSPARRCSTPPASGLALTTGCAGDARTEGKSLTRTDRRRHEIPCDAGSR